MDRINHYRELVQNILTDHAKHPTYGDMEIQLILDSERDHYQICHLGWDGQTRIYACLIHVDIKGGKIWIESDGTEIGVADQLVEAGVPKHDIVLGFKAPYKRAYTEFAVG